MRHVFQRPERLATVKEIIQAKKDNEEIIKLRERLLPGSRTHDMYGYPIVRNKLLKPEMSHSEMASPDSRYA